MNAAAQQPVERDRESARLILHAKVTAPPPLFSTIDPAIITADAEWRLRWIDCAPEGARHGVAPMQDKQGVPCGTCFSENMGPTRDLRDARIRHGLHPISGQPVAYGPATPWAVESGVKGAMRVTYRYYTEQADAQAAADRIRRSNST